MKLLFLQLLIACLLPLAASAQTPKAKKDPLQEKYEWRIRQEVLYDVYIPKDVNEAFLQFNKLIDEPSKAKLKAVSEEEASRKLFFSLGRWITHNWGFYEGSRLSVHLQGLGIHHPDDMARFLIIAYHRNLTKRPLDIKALIEQFKQKEEQEKQERLQNGKILHEEIRKKEKPALGKGQ